MKKNIITLAAITLFAVTSAFAQGYKVGDKAASFKLKNTDGKLVSTSDYPSAKGFIIVFTCNHCPYAKAYQDRIIALDKKYKSKGYPVIAINSNDVATNAEDSYENMIVRAKEKGFTFPYLHDETGDVCRKFGATRTPQVFVLEKKGSDLLVRYTGAIDDNSQDAAKVTAPYLANAVEALLAGNTPNPASTKAIGCGISLKAAK
jgi:peroxiredoxin